VICCVYALGNLQSQTLCDPSAKNAQFLRSKAGFSGDFEWLIRRYGDVTDSATVVSKPGYQTDKWLPAIIPGTILNTLVYNKIYPEPYFGDNNRKINKLIPDIADAGREFYHYWFRTEFT